MHPSVRLFSSLFQNQVIYQTQIRSVGFVLLCFLFVPSIRYGLIRDPRIGVSSIRHDRNETLCSMEYDRPPSIHGCRIQENRRCYMSMDNTQPGSIICLPTSPALQPITNQESAKLMLIGRREIGVVIAPSVAEDRNSLGITIKRNHGC